ncbi:MAG: PEP-CTERM sorting domain-containing protein [Armatimonadota bacterium]|nr:PEP-CTERM sorting domain-containing protein [Armatimonadota bacterium]
MRRATFVLALTAALVVCLSGSLAAIGPTNPVSNYNFSSGLSNWQVGHMSDLTNPSFGSLPDGTSVHIAPWRDTLNPSLEWFRWDESENPAPIAIGAAQLFEEGIPTGNYSTLTFSADFWLKGQSWTSPQASGGSEWYPAFMAVYYQRDGVDGYAMRGIYHPSVGTFLGSSAVEWDQLNVTQTWNLYDSGMQQGDKIMAIAVGGYGQNFAAQVDNVYLGGTPVPEPASLTGLLTGLSGLGLLARRRRR